MEDSLRGPFDEFCAVRLFPVTVMVELENDPWNLRR